MFKYKNALLSVFDKNEIEVLAKFLIKKKIQHLFNGRHLPTPKQAEDSP